MRIRSIFFQVALISASLLLPAGVLDADNKKAADPNRGTVAKPLTDRQKKNQDEKLRKELEGPYRKWLTEDVLYIITDEEKSAFKAMGTEDERENFIESFWMRRDPTPDSMENGLKEEHYRRIAYANERYASGIPGWKTDRGRIYITFGPPDENETHPSGGTYERSYEEGGGTTSTYPFEKWRYRHLEGIGSDVIIEFVDTTMTGEYRMTMDPSEKDALMIVPGARLTLMEQMGFSSKTGRFSRADNTRLGIGNQPTSMKMNQFERLKQFTDILKAPPLKLNDWEAVVTSRVKFNILPIHVRADFMKITSTSVQTNITLQLERKDLLFQNKDGIAKSAVNIYARITTMARRVANVFEDSVAIEFPNEILEEASAGANIYQKSVPLAPGTYRLNLVVKDVYGGNMNNYEMVLNVPLHEDEKLTFSSVVLADLIEKVDARSIGRGPFVIGTTKVRPRVSETFKRNEKMGIFVKLYNFQTGERSNKPSGSIQYEVTKEGSDQKLLEFSGKVGENTGSGFTIEKMLPLNTLEPGRYTLRMKVTDNLRKQTVTPTATFVVT